MSGGRLAMGEKGEQVFHRHGVSGLATCSVGSEILRTAPSSTGSIDELAKAIL